MSSITRQIVSISTALQPSEPLPKDKIIEPAQGSRGMQYLERRRYIYRWKNPRERDLDKIIIYQGTVTPPASQIRFYKSKAKKLVPIFENGNEIEPPLRLDSELPYATIITIREFLPHWIPLPSISTNPAHGEDELTSIDGHNRQMFCEHKSADGCVVCESLAADLAAKSRLNAESSGTLKRRPEDDNDSHRRRRWA